jgi:hypothetical protein
MNLTNIENGNQEVTVKSTSGLIYYKVEINKENKLGNWRFKNEIPFKEVFSLNSTIVKKANSDDENLGGGGGCETKPYMECMNCLIVKVCGSDFMCILACGALIAQCLAGASLVCVLG